MAMIAVTLNCSHSQPPLPPSYPPTILLCHILSQITGKFSNTSDTPIMKNIEPFLIPPYPSSLPFSPWKPGDAYTLGGKGGFQTR